MSRPTLAIYGSKDLDTRDYSVFTHDHNLCLMQDGKIITYLELERYTRHKYDNRLDLFIEDLFNNKIIELPDEYDFVLANDFLSSSFISKNGNFRFESKGCDCLQAELIPGKLTVIKGEFAVKKYDAWCCPHELAHIFSAIPFYGELKENSLLFSFDGASSFGNYSSFIYKNGKLELIENNWSDLKKESKFFNDNALAFKILGLQHKEHTSVPGKLMGYASWGHYDQKIENWLKENEYFHTWWDRTDEILKSINDNFGLTLTSFDTHEPFFQNVAATFQKLFEEAIVNKLSDLQEKYKCDYLYYGGGCALNIVANSRIMQSRLFKDVFIAPCCNDGGLSIGAATMLEISKGNTIEVTSPYVCNAGLEKSEKNEVIIDSQCLKDTVDLLLNNAIVGICNGVSECGPRALGNRSLIAVPDSKAVAKKLSMEVKKREWYRPVAPIMLKETVQQVAVENPEKLAKFMLMDFHIKEEYKKELEGVVHADGTARIQIIENEWENPFIFKLLTELKKKGILALINTSFNAAGEPIVHTKTDALKSAAKMKLDGLILNGKLLKKGDF